MPYFVYIDDETELGELFEDLHFPRDDCDYRYFSSPSEAIKFISSENVVAVLCDQQMPEMLGTEVSERIASKVPFFLVTGNLDFEVSLYKNIRKVFSKPMKEDDFESILNSLQKSSSTS